MDEIELFKYKPTEERLAAETFIALMDGKSSDVWLEEISQLDPFDNDDRAMLEAISKNVKDIEVRKEATRRLYYTR